MIESQQKHEDIALRIELLELVGVMANTYRKNPTDHLAELITDTYNLAREYEKKITTHSYSVERLPLSMV